MVNRLCSYGYIVPSGIIFCMGMERNRRMVDYIQLHSGTALRKGPDGRLQECDLEVVRMAIQEYALFGFDLDGTLCLEGKPLPGATAFINGLREEEKPIFFVTNNSSASQEEYQERLQECGFAPQMNEIILSTHSVIDWLDSQRYARCFVLGMPALVSMLAEAGYPHCTARPDIIVVGYDKTFTFAKVTEVCRMVKQGIPYVVTHADYWCPTADGPEPDAGALAAMIALTTGIQPIWVGGKPNQTMIDVIARRAGRPLQDMIFLGDRLSTDIQLALNAGMASVFVLSGQIPYDQIAATTPHFVVNSVQDLVPDADRGIG